MRNNEKDAVIVKQSSLITLTTFVMQLNLHTLYDRPNTIMSKKIQAVHSKTYKCQENF